MDSIGYFIMMALLCAGAAYGLANKGKPKPKVSSGQRKIERTDFLYQAE